MNKLLLSAFALVMGATVSHAADLGVPRTPVAAAVVAPAFNWSGFYLGADVGFIATRYRLIDVAVPFTAAHPNPSGAKIGLHLGYRHQFANNIVVGLEGDLSWLGASRTGFFTGFPVAIRGHARMDGSVRGSLGIAADRVLLYATGGLAFLNVGGCTVPNVGAPCIAGTSFSGTRIGWTAGAGLAYAINNNWSVRAEYLYANYGTKTFTPPAYTARVSNETHTVRLGVSYMFTTGPSAVVARY